MPTILDAINTVKTGLLTLALAEYGHIQLHNITGISPGSSPQFFFDEEGFNKISKLRLSITTILCHQSHSIIFPVPEWQLKDFSSLKIFKKFPAFFDIININNYSNLKEKILNKRFYDRCYSMQTRWQYWKEAGIPHFISCLQTLQRQLASLMKNPFILDFDYDLKNGLSFEYQSEIYSNHLYGAKLLDAWHIYLMESKGKHPELFSKWLATQSQQKLAEMDILHLNDIPTVKYITDDKERQQWQLTITLEKIVKNDLLPIPKKVNDEIEIIFDLGKGKFSELQFFGAIKQRGYINHSTFFAGEKVFGAGRMRLKAIPAKNQSLHWMIHAVDDNSGHIKPNDKMNIHILEALKKIGCDLNSIDWKTVWGHPGLRIETAEMAYNRLKNHCIEIKMPALDNEQLKTPFLIQLNDAAREGLLGKINDLLNTHALTSDESIPTANLIKKGLTTHLFFYTNNPAHPNTASQLALKAKKILRDAGTQSKEFENDLEKIILNYKKYFQNQSETGYSPLSIKSLFKRKRNEIIKEKLEKTLEVRINKFT